MLITAKLSRTSECKNSVILCYLQTQLLCWTWLAMLNSNHWNWSDTVHLADSIKKNSSVQLCIEVVGIWPSLCNCLCCVTVEPDLYLTWAAIAYWFGTHSLLPLLLINYLAAIDWCFTELDWDISVVWIKKLWSSVLEVPMPKILFRF